MKVLVACEFSGIVREEFNRLGHNAWSCDLLPTEIDGQHIQGNVLDYLNEGWDLMVAHPPCTYLANSGVMWLGRQPDRWKSMQEGAKFFKTLLEAPIKSIAVENPIMHKYAVEIVGKRQDQLIQPYMFGHLESKATCLWLKNLPKLIETDNVFEPMKLLPKKQSQRVHYIPPSENRWKERSRTFVGIAKAMANQWGSSMI